MFSATESVDETKMSEICSSVLTTSTDAIIHHLYLWEGLFIIIFNSLLMLIIMKEEKLRSQREFLLYAGCLVFEVLFGITYMVSGAVRLNIYYSNKYFPLITRNECLLRPYNLMFVYITPCVGFLVFIISLDRFISVFMPVKYMQFSNKYVMFNFLLVTLMPVPFVVASLFTTAQLPRIQNVTDCGLSAATTGPVYITLRVARVTFSILGALLYIPIIVRIRLFCDNSSRRILRTTITVLLISLSTLTLYTIPDIILLLDPHYKSKFFFILNLNKGVVNVFIFLFTQRTIRDAVLGVIMGKYYSNHSQASWRNHQTTAPVIIRIEPERADSMSAKRRE